MNYQQPDHKLNGMAQTLTAGLSRRKALKLLVQGAVGGLLAKVAVGSAPVQAQNLYLPSLLNSTASPRDGEDDFCLDDPECLGEYCCLSATAIDFGWFRNHLLDEILPKWLHSVTDQGLFLPHF